MEPFAYFVRRVTIPREPLKRELLHNIQGFADRYGMRFTVLNNEKQDKVVNDIFELNGMYIDINKYLERVHLANEKIVILLKSIQDISIKEMHK